MDAAKFAQLDTEVKALPIVIDTYDKGVSDFLSGAVSTCPHFLDSISSLVNDVALSVAYDLTWSGQGSAYGAVLSFVHEIEAYKRHANILPTNKSRYYVENSTEVMNSKTKMTGEAARTMAYINGNSPDQGIMI